MATKPKGSNKYRSMRNGAAHRAEDCAICAGRTCRVIVASPVDGEFEAQLVPLENGRTKLEGVRHPHVPSFPSDRYIGSSGPVHKPLPKGYVGGWRRPGTGLIHIPCATALVMQALQTWGTSHARL